MRVSDPDLFQARIQAVLQEVQFIRQEILDNITREFQLHTATITIYGAIIAFTFQQKEPQVLLIAPIIAWAFTVLWMTYKKHLDASSFYLLEMEESKWVDLIGKRDVSGSEACQLATKINKYQQYWVSWQHFHDRKDMRPSVVVANCIHKKDSMLIVSLPSPRSSWEREWKVSILIAVNAFSAN